MVHRLPFWSTATPARAMKLPCEVLLPSIVARYLPLELNSWTTLVPASPTYTVPLVVPLVLSTATLVGVVNWPAPAPGMPAWQAVLLLQTSLISAPSLTPHPQAEMNLPFLSKRSTRALPLSATYTLPFRWLTATPTGPWNWPEAVPVVPNEPRFFRNDTSVWNVSSSPLVVPAEFVATTRKW